MASQVESVRRVILELGIPDQWLQSDEIAGYFEEMIACSSGMDAAEFKETLRASLHEAWVGHQEAMKLPVLGEAALEQPAVPSLPERPVEAPAPGPKKARVHVATALEREIKDVLGKGCTICGASTAKLLCVCKTTRYCSVQCQRVDWSQRGHRSVCRKIRERAEAAARHEEVQREEAPRDEPLYGPAPRSYADDVRDRIRAEHEAARSRREAEPEPELMSARFGSRCPICLDGWDVSAAPDHLRACCCSMMCDTCHEKLKKEPCPICRAPVQSDAERATSLQRHVKDEVVEAMVMLARGYLSEVPCNLGLRPSGKRALKLLERAVELGDSIACVKLGDLLHEGFNGVKINRRKALQLYKRVEKLGHVDAHFSIGVHGGNYGSAYQMKHFRLAAEKGHAKAELSLGHYFEAGLCVERDLEEARRLYSSASARGLAIAQKCVDRLDRGEPLAVDDVLDPGFCSSSEA